MFFFGSKHFARLSLTLVLSAGLFTACAPSVKGRLGVGGVATGVAAFDSSTASCIETMRSRIEASTIPFEHVDPLVDQFADEANNQFATFETKEFSFRQSNGATVSLETLAVLGNPRSWQTLGYGLVANPPTAAAPFSVTVDYQTFDGRTAKRLSQTFNVSSECVLVRAGTTFDTLTTTLLGYDLHSLSISQDGGKKPSDYPFSIGQGQRLLNFDMANDPRFARDGDIEFIKAAGAVLIKSAGTKVESVEKFGRHLNFESRLFNSFVDDKEFFPLKISEDRAANIVRAEFAGDTTWTVPRDLWRQEKLKGSLTFGVDLELPPKYLDEKISYVVEAKQVPAYDHIDAYFTIVPLSPPSVEPKTFVFIEKADPTVKAVAGPEDLASNATLDQSNPEVQRIVRSILAQKPADRRERIRLVLTYLSENYKFDREMMTSNSIEPLTVAEALARGKGVCQHYSVIFTTLARAIGVPTRIVVGYVLSDHGATPHAWVESEVEPGLFQVIEPQFKEGLTQTATRDHVPAARGDYFEDIDGHPTAGMKAFNEMRMKITPFEPKK